MFRPLLLASAFLVPVVGATCGDDGAATEKKLLAAKEEYDKAIAAAKQGVVAALKTKADAAQKQGDLKALEKLTAELKAFEGAGTLPMSVITFGYETERRRARGKMEEAYAAAVKQLTIAGNIAQAKTVQTELDEFKKATTAAAVDPKKLPPGAALAVGDSFSGSFLKDKLKSATPAKLVITKIVGTRFEATLASTPVKAGTEIKLVGTYAKGAIAWQVVDPGTNGGSRLTNSYAGVVKDGVIEVKSVDTKTTVFAATLTREDPEKKDVAPDKK